MTQDNNDVIDLPSNASLAQAGSNAIYNKITDPLDAIQKMGEMIAGSGMFGCSKVEQGCVLAMTCLAEGKAPLELAKTYHIIEGKLTMRSDAMLGRFLTSGGKVKWLVRTNDEVRGMWSHDGNEIEIGCTVEEMKTNGVALSGKGGLKDNWRKFPRQMLTARCISEAVRLLAPQIVSGIYTPEEVQDFNSPAPQQAQIAHQPAERPRLNPNRMNVIEAPQPAKAEVVDPRAEVIARLTDLLDKYEPNATAYLKEKKYIRNGQTYRDLDAITAQRILGNPAKIIGILEGLNG
jgi:hypothetical protein